MEELKASGFNSLYEYDGNVYGLYGLWSLQCNHKSKIGFIINLKLNGQTLQSILEIKTIKYIANENNERMMKESS